MPPKTIATPEQVEAEKRAKIDRKEIVRGAPMTKRSPNRGNGANKDLS